MKVRKLNIHHGGLLVDAIEEMIELAREGNFTAEQELNGVIVRVNGDSNADLILRDQWRAQSGYIKGEVGPYPKAELTAEDKASDARVEAEVENESKRQQQEREAEYKKKMRAHRERVEAKLVNAPAIELADEVGWQKSKQANSDDYSSAVMAFSERWARLMQVEMANGKKLEDVADATFQEADLEGITGFMYRHAISQLVACWKHGEQLRCWYNTRMRA